MFWYVTMVWSLSRSAYLLPLIGIPAVPTDVIADDITTDSINISWTISYVAITRETYVVMYGVNMKDLNMNTDSLDSRGQTLINQSYSVVLDDLESATTYYYQVVSENDFSLSSSDIYSFTTLEGGNIITITF